MHYVRMCSSVTTTCFIISRIAKCCAIDHLYVSALAEGRKVLSKASEKPFSCTRVSLAQVVCLYHISAFLSLPVAEFSATLVRVIRIYTVVYSAGNNNGPRI